MLLSSYSSASISSNRDRRVEVQALIGPGEATQTNVLRELMNRSYDVLHFAGHCVYNAQTPTRSGWIFTGGQLVTANEIRRVDRVPSFIFSNACESGITPDRSGRRSDLLAPTFAEAFFARGVANFVCTAWPVADLAARDFALTLYAERGLGYEKSEGCALIPRATRPATRSRCIGPCVLLAR
ncbi:CHAT domain-containing protein [Candidatus Amarolinea dominans]|uniref:CHAT domain-containing protein n=1 Tax=Candidatus Amarolinea dominans TaxID=3140696 RepID=UPI003136D1B3|nr:CHAT domain-containing protein [Anaerolineae bacterium]